MFTRRNHYSRQVNKRNALLPRRRLHSLNGSLDVLELLASARAPMTLADLAAGVGLSKAAIHGVMSNLEARNYVERISERGGYRLGHRVWELGVAAGETIELPKVARPFLQRLVELSAESAQLAEYCSPGEVVYLDIVFSPNPVQAQIHVGRRAPAACTATGRALLALQSDEEIERICSGPLKRYSPQTITDGAQLRRELELTRGRGYSINYGEYRGEIVGIGAPIRNYQDKVIAAVSLSGPSYRLDAQRAIEFAPAVIRAAQDIALAYGQRFLQKRRV